MLNISIRKKLETLYPDLAPKEGIPALDYTTDPPKIKIFYWPARLGEAPTIEEINARYEPYVRKLIISNYEVIIGKKLDEKAKEKGYDSIISACSYANSTNPVYQKDAEAFISLRDDSWTKFYSAVNDEKDDELLEKKLTDIGEWICAK